MLIIFKTTYIVLIQSMSPVYMESEVNNTISTLIIHLTHILYILSQCQLYWLLIVFSQSIVLITNCIWMTSLIMGWDDQLLFILFICSVFRSCKGWVQIDCWQLLYTITADHLEVISFALFLLVSLSVSSIICNGKNNWYLRQTVIRLLYKCRRLKSNNLYRKIGIIYHTLTSFISVGHISLYVSSY